MSNSSYVLSEKGLGEWKAWVNTLEDSAKQAGLRKGLVRRLTRNLGLKKSTVEVAFGA